jgi:hypothetical protein
LRNWSKSEFAPVAIPTLSGRVAAVPDTED